MGSHSIIFHPTQVNAPLAKQADTWFVYRRGMEGWVDLGGLLYTEMIYLSADSQPSK